MLLHPKAERVKFDAGQGVEINTTVCEAKLLNSESIRVNVTGLGLGVCVLWDQQTKLYGTFSIYIIAWKQGVQSAYALVRGGSSTLN